MSQKPNISVVVPCYKSTYSLPELVERLDKTLAQLCNEFEIILVNDASPDTTSEEINKLANEYSSIQAIELTRNFGQQAAVLCGFNEATFDYVATLDDDLQHAPEDIPALYNHLIDNNLDLVIAALNEKKHGFIRSLGSKLVKWLSVKILGVPKDFKFSSFRVMKKEVAINSLKFVVSNPVVGFLLIKSTNKYGNLILDHRPRKYGTSNYSTKALIKYCLTMMLDYSVLPLQAVGYTGAIISTLSICTGIYYFINWLTGNITVSGFTTIILLICFFFGLLFISLGIIGAYFIRIIQNSNYHPTFLARKKN